MSVLAHVACSSVGFSVGMLKSFFLKNRLSFAKIDFFSIIVSDVTVTIGCWNMLGCREG